MAKVLFITYKKSKNILEGGGQCTKRNIDCISAVVGTEKVEFYYVHDENKKPSLWDYFCGAFFTPFNYYYGLSPKRVRQIVSLSKNFDIVFIDRSLFGIIAKKLKQSGYQGKIISFFHNIEKIYFDAKLPKWLPLRWILLHCADKNDRYSCVYSDTVAALNQRDAELIKKLYKRKTDHLIPIALPDRCKDYIPGGEMTSTQPSCLFLGTYFKPNNEGILWFVKNVLPQVSIKMKIVGKGMQKLKEENECLKDIEMLSDVPDLAPYMREADIMVLPIFSGSGMKVKTCESLMYGKNIIGTTEAFEGYEVDFERVGGKCDTAEGFITKIKQFENAAKPRYNTYSRKMYLEKYSNDAVLNVFADMLKDDKLPQ